ncbi:MAG: oxidoreductase [Rhodospirillales bacterium]|nr:oxidoreductase [Rhodospirillales bacterium]
MSFQALMLHETDGKVSQHFTTLEDKDLPEGDVRVKIEYTTVNYKDGMILAGIGKQVATYPHIPGIDFAGTVEESASPKFKPGDAVILTGWRVGEVHWGGYAGKARVKADWLVPMPTGLNAKRAMALGTAGFTAMLAIMALEAHGMTPKMEGEVLVTGASGGVGSVAVAVLAARGYTVAASTGRPETHEYLTMLGAKALVARADLAQQPKRPMLSERWIGCIDNVGGTTMANAIASLKHRCSLASVGLTESNMVTTSVLPFLLRGTNILGIDSGISPYAERVAAWSRLAKELPMDKLDAMTQVKGFNDLPAVGQALLKGQVKGRVVIDVNR